MLLCRENVLSLLLSLPRVIRGESDDDIFRSLNLLAGYLSILGPETTKLLAFARNTKRFSTFLVQLLEFDKTDITLIAERAEVQDPQLGYKGFDMILDHL